MFGTLDRVLDNNPTITIKTSTNTYLYQVFSYYETLPEAYYLQTEFLNLNKYLEFLNTIKNRSMKDYNVLVLETDKIITLSTCSLDNTKRIVVHGKLLSIN